MLGVRRIQSGLTKNHSTALAVILRPRYQAFQAEPLLG